MTQRVRFLTDCFEAGVVRYHAGRHYPATPLTLAQGGARALPTWPMLQTGGGAWDEWNKANERTIMDDPAMRNDPNPAAALVKRLLSDLV